jgi:DNA-binding NarL/FixJ family response regulator
VSVAAQESEATGATTARILVTGSDLLAGALAGALETYGFAATQIEPNPAEIDRWLVWEPDLVLIDARSFDIDQGSAVIGRVHRAGLQACVIDAADDDRELAWSQAGSCAFVDREEPFDQLFQTIKRLLHIWSAPGVVRRSALRTTNRGVPKPSNLQPFADLTEREKVVLAGLVEGHCAEEIAKEGFVSISTVRSQIKSILYKFGVKSQLAAVAMARRAEWSLDAPSGTPEDAFGSRRRRVS